MLLKWSCQEAEEELEDTASNQDTACEACGGWQGHTTVVWGYRGGLICVCIYNYIGCRYRGCRNIIPTMEKQMENGKGHGSYYSWFRVCRK